MTLRAPVRAKKKPSSMAAAEALLSTALSDPALRTSLRQRCTPQVARWEWATFSRHELEPGYFLLHKFGRGRVLSAAPDPPQSGAHGHGFDADGRLLITRQQTEFRGKLYETFFVKEGDQTIAYYYTYDGEIGSVTVCVEDGAGRVVSSDAAYKSGGRLHNDFAYDDAGALVSRRMTGRDSSARVVDDVFEIERGPNGGVERVWWTCDGRRHLHIDRTKKPAKKPAPTTTTRKEGRGAPPPAPEKKKKKKKKKKKAMKQKARTR